ncbi:MAG: MxaS protein [Methylomonas sp.]|nr:MxaS protein [Methylomonas sp.]PPD20216.1 MAG: MxaS protein [Methylomonas sp.]PPD26265.1 MAG: MxaS protein [Methylomonas sp.]PPD37982.1 MAG: MxaS protein [Methylomonas sp.]PPD40364.1 MAG: MxaS protein [Methylomonas sp.]
MTASIRPFHYRLARPGYNVFPGAHPGQLTGSGQLFKRHEPLLASPDPRRIDLRASVLNPFDDYRVKVFQQHSKLAVYLIADLSASMQRALPVLCDFLLSAAQSAADNGDSLGFIGCGPALSPRWQIPASASFSPLRRLAQDLRSLQTEGTADSLVHIAPLLPSRRSLLFLLSDCHFSATLLRNILHPIAHHAVVPIVPWPDAEFRRLPDWGLVRFKDAEDGRGRTLWMRPGLKRRIEQAFDDRQNQLRQSFRAFGMEPLFMTGDYDADILNHYFLQHAL